jgi:DNA-binding PadR family transcriptional regulator
VVPIVTFGLLQSGIAVASWDRPVFENALLGLLCEGPKHGYEVCQRFASNGEWSAVGELARSQVYALLKSLERQGQAVAVLEEGERGPARRVYTLTEEGRGRFLEWVRRPVHSVRGLRVEFPLKLHFLRRLGLAGAEDLIEAQEAVLLERRRSLGEAGRGEARGLTSWVLDLQQRLIEAGLGWLREQRTRGEGL